MFVPIRADRIVKTTQKRLLFCRQVDRCFNGDARKQIAPSPVTDGRHSLATQTEILAGLSTGRDFQRDMTVERRQFYLAAQSSSAETDRHFAGQVCTAAMEDLVGTYANLDIEVARRAAVAASLSFTRKPDPIAIFDALWNFSLSGVCVSFWMRLSPSVCVCL